MKILVIDGQGGGVGKSLIAALKREMPTQPLIALGTNTQATAAMLKAGADQGATGENAIRYQCKSADVIVGVTGLLNANSMLGEVSPAIAMAISLSEAQKVLVPLERCGLYVAGVGQQRLDSLIREAAHSGGFAGRTDGSGGRVKRSFAKKPAESGFFRQSLTEGNKS